MVVASEGRKKHGAIQYNSNSVNMAHPWTSGPEPPASEMCVPKAVLMCMPHSHPFEERTILLEQPVKIGRNVPKAIPSPNNAIFECRVLSRNHATLWYENGHFYIMDNRSSNGTFINNNRCSGEELVPHEVYSGDVVQFGVDVIENANKGGNKIIYPCIMAMLKLFLPNGTESKTSTITMTSPLPLKELYELNQYVQEAIQREATLEAKLTALQHSVEASRGATGAAWHALVGEQRLLGRVRALEAQLAASGRGGSGQAGADITQLLLDKENYQEAAQESLRSAHEQQLVLESRLSETQRELVGAHADAAGRAARADAAHSELQRLAERCERQMASAKAALRAADDRELAAREKGCDERTALAETVAALTKQVHALQAENSVMRMIEPCQLDPLERALGGPEDSIKEGATLHDAIRNLPDYIKIMLPEHVLNKVGCKAVLAVSKHVKEMEMELFIVKSELFELEKSNELNASKEEKVSDKIAEELAMSGVKEHAESDTSTDDEKTVRGLHESYNSDTEDYCIDSKLDLESTVLDAETVSSKSQSDLSDNNANSTFNPAELTNHNEIQLNDKQLSDGGSNRLTRLRENIGRLTRQLDLAYAERTSNRLIQLQTELTNSQGIIETLKHQVVCLKDITDGENSTLRQVRDELLSKNLDLHTDVDNLTLKCNQLELALQQQQEGDEKKDDNAESMYKEQATEYHQKLISAATVEEADKAEIERLSLKVTELTAELLQQPLLSDIDKLTSSVGTLRSELDNKESLINTLRTEVQLAKDANEILETKLEEIESEKEQSTGPSPKEREDKAIMTCDFNESLSQQDTKTSETISQTTLKLDDEDRIKIMLADREVTSGHMETQTTVHMLEEELMMTKEKWALLVEEKAHLTAELYNLQEKYKQMSLGRSNILMYILPVVAAFMYLLFYQYIS